LKLPTSQQTKELSNHLRTDDRVKILRLVRKPLFSVSFPGYDQDGFSAISRRRRAGVVLYQETGTPPYSFETRDEDNWVAFDKLQHVTFGFLFTLGAQYAFVNKASLSETHALPYSVSVSTIVGISKEVYDWQVGPTHHFSRRDLLADGLGILLAVGLILL